MTARGLVDLLIPRGGADLIRTVVTESTVPVIETGVGNCHVYVDRAADLDKALAITVNSKTHRPSVCNAAESLLVHRDVAAEFLPKALAALAGEGVTLHTDADAGAQAEAAGVAHDAVTDEQFATEFHGLEMSVGVVDDLDAALEHIRRYGSGHTEAIVTEDRAAARRFTAEVDAAAVMVNASTRFTDGGEFGFGAEIGISTQKLHARGPMALPELTTTKWVVEGDGQIRRLRLRARPVPASGRATSRESWATKYSGRAWTAAYVRPTYSPRMPSASSCTAPTAATMTTVDVQPGRVLPSSIDTSAKTSTPSAATPPSSPSHVANRRGAIENPVTLSTESRIILPSGYFESPAARAARA